MEARCFELTYLRTHSYGKAGFKPRPLGTQPRAGHMQVIRSDLGTSGPRKEEPEVCRALMSSQPLSNMAGFIADTQSATSSRVLTREGHEKAQKEKHLR